MLNCDRCQELITDALYDALNASQQQSLQSHLEKCTECRQLYTEMREATDALNAKGIRSGLHDDIPERVALDTLWDNLQPELNRIDAERFRALPHQRNQRMIGISVALAASLALLIAILPLLSSNDTASPEPVANALISPELMDYLTRAEVMLLLVANAETQNVSAVPIRPTFARDLALEANVLNTNMQRTINSGQSQLLHDIEFLLLQIANLDSSNMEQGVQLLQQYIEKNSVLFKIRLLEMRAQESFI